MKIDPHSATWLSIMMHVDTRIAELRNKLEGNCDWEDIVAARAALRELKQLLAMAVPEEPPLVSTYLDIPS